MERFWVLPGSLRTSKSTFSPQRGSKFLKIALLLFEALSERSGELQRLPQSSQEHPFGAPGCPKSPPKLSQGLPRASLETFKISKISISEPSCLQELSKSPPRVLLDRFSSCFCSILDGFRIDSRLCSVKSCCAHVHAILSHLHLCLALDWCDQCDGRTGQ